MMLMLVTGAAHAQTFTELYDVGHVTNDPMRHP
jgi:hypothetical protein